MLVFILVNMVVFGIAMLKLNLKRIPKQNLYVITKTCNGHKQPQTSTNNQQATRKCQRTTTNYQKTTTNGHPNTSNQKTDVSFLLLAPGNYKHNPDLEKLMQSVRENCFLLSQYLCGASKTGSDCFGRLSSQYFSCQQEKFTFLLFTFTQKGSCFLVI